MLKIKPFQQQYGYCGPASLKMVLDYFGVEKTENELARMTGCTSENGVELKKLLWTAQELGLQGFIKDSTTFTDIREFVLGKKIPVIVDWFSIDDGHYSVVVDIDQKNIYLLDPAIGRVRAMQLKKFRRVWFDFPGDYLKTKEELLIRKMLVVYKL